MNGEKHEKGEMTPVSYTHLSADVKQVSYDPEAAAQTLADKGVTELHMLAYTNPRPYNLSLIHI